MNLHLPIHHTYGPHVDREFLFASLGISYVPWRYRHGRGVEALRQELSQRFHGDVSLFGSAREGLLALLRCLRIQEGDEVIVQGFTCIVVPNAIQAAGAVPIYADIERETLNLDANAVEKAITRRTRVIICQHTFGIPANTKALREICNRHGLVLIEDCAHVLPDDAGPDIIGKEGDFMLLSFGRDKAISGIAGGAVLSRDEEISQRLQAEEKTASDLSLWRIAMLLNYPSIHRTARWLFPLRLGKLFLWLMRKMGFLIPIMDAGEYSGLQKKTVHKIPNACAYLAWKHLNRLRQLNEHRRSLTRFYREESVKRSWPVLGAIRDDLPLQKFPLFIKDAESIRGALKTQNIFLDDGWTNCVVCPSWIQIDATLYRWGMDPEAESVCEQILSLPTHPTMSLVQARRLVGELEKHLKWKTENHRSNPDILERA